MIETRGLTKRYGGLTAVDELTFDVRPGLVTALLGRNGAGKSTTLRLALGLDRPTAGTVRISGRDYTDLPEPLRTVGAHLDSSGAHGGRTARDHLRWLAASNRIPRQRVETVLDLVDLGSVADRRVRGFSLGMRQRLGLAAALIGDPQVLLLDEPTNGLDAEGIRWLRTFLRELAAEGRTVLVSSHLMAEVARTADRLIVVARGRLVADAPLREFLDLHAERRLRVRTAEGDRLRTLLAARGARVVVAPDGVLCVTGVDAEEVGAVAHEYSVTLRELALDERSLEEVFLALTGEADTARDGRAS